MSSASRSTKLRNQRIDVGLCPDCGRASPDAGTRCDPCAAAQRARTAKSRARGVPAPVPADAWGRRFRFDGPRPDYIPGSGTLADAVAGAKRYRCTITVTDSDGAHVAVVRADGTVEWSEMPEVHPAADTVRAFLALSRYTLPSARLLGSPDPAMGDAWQALRCIASGRVDDARAAASYADAIWVTADAEGWLDGVTIFLAKVTR